MRKIRKTIMAVGEKVSRPVLLCEVGYKATPNTARQPWEWHDAATQPVDLAVQKTLYEAVRDVFDPDRDPDAARMGGLYFWKWYADLDWGGAENSDFTPRGTSTSGSVYVLGPDGTQWVVRVLGVTARARVLRRDRATGAWVHAF
jgi:hypothetical protein